MFRINIVGKQTAKCDGMNVRCKGTFSKNAAGEGKLTLKATDYLEFDEKGAGFGGCRRYVTCGISVGFPALYGPAAQNGLAGPYFSLKPAKTNGPPRPSGPAGP